MSNYIQNKLSLMRENYNSKIQYDLIINHSLKSHPNINQTNVLLRLNHNKIHIYLND